MAVEAKMVKWYTVYGLRSVIRYCDALGTTTKLSFSDEL